MTIENPYEAPATDPILTTAPAGDAIQLATLSDRFSGAFLDGLIGLGIIIPIWGVLFGLGMIHSVADIQFLGLPYTIGLCIVQYILMMAIQWKSLNATGQTIGKKVMKIRIANMDGSKPNVWVLVIKRYGFVSLLSLLSLISMIQTVRLILTWLDILLIFRRDRRCLHDLIAGTQVVTVKPAA